MEGGHDLGRRSAQRFARKFHARERLRDAILGLNWLAGFGLEENPRIQEPDSLQHDVLCRASFLSNLCNDKGDLSQVPKPEAALKVLLQGRSEYGSEAPTTLAACALERISLPGSLKDAPYAADLLDVGTRRYLQCPEQMLRPEAELCLEEFHPYWDPMLKNRQRMYKKFIQKLHAADYLVYTQSPKSFCGVFFVKKSDGKKIRMIIDARGTNRLFKEPPGVHLLTSDGFSRIELDVPQGIYPGEPAYENFISQRKIHMGLSDVKDCFHRLRQPKWLAEYFCFEGIPASWVGLGGKELDGVQLKPDSIIFPAPGSLSMGFTWSLFFAQKINERMMSQVTTLKHSSLASDRSEAMVFAEEGEKAKVHHYVYVDNLGIMSTDEHTVDESLKEVQEVFEKEQLILHPGVVHSQSVKALGCNLCGELLASRVTPERFHRLHQALAAILNRKKVSGRILEVVIGHATFVALTNRGLLSVFNTVYKFMRSHYYTPAVLWRTVREELFVFRSLMIYLHADWGRQWNEYVTASDSSLTGYGIVSSFWKREDVAKVGRLQERARFRKLGSHSARESALTSAGFIRDEVSREWVAGWLDDQDYLSMAGWGLSKDFQEVPSQFLRRDMWTPRLWGRWKHSSGILELEARALVMSLRRIALSVFGHDIRQLLLTDNMSVCLSFDRSRAKSYPLLKQIRVFTAYCLARNITCTIRWVPSELNSADEPSRLDSSEKSKTLVHAIPTIVKGSEGALPSCPSREKEVGSPQETSPSDPARIEFIQSREDPITEEVVCGEGFDNSQAPGSVQLGGCQSRLGTDSKEATTRVIHGLNQLHSERQEEESQGLGASCIKAIKALSGSEYGGRRHDPARVSSYQAGYGSSVPYPAEGVHGLCAFQEGEYGGSGRGGQSPGRSHECYVHGRISELPCRSSSRSFPSHLSPIREEWIPEAAPQLAGNQRFSQDDSRKESEGAAAGSMGSFCSGDEAKRFPQNGHISSPCRINLCEALGIAESSSVFTGEAGCRSYKGVVNASKSRGGRGDKQDRRIRHQRVVRFSLDGKLGEPSLRVPEEEPPRMPSVGFRLSRLQQGVPRDRQDVWSGGHSLSNTAQWPKHRQVPKLQKSTRGAKERAMESSKEHHEVRESSKVGKHLGSLAPEVQGLRPRVRGKPWGDLVGPKARTNLQRRRCVANSYIMDLFSGEGGVAKACTEMGLRAKEWDIKNGSQQDLTKRSVVKRLIREVKRGRVVSCMMAPVCTSFSVARDRTKIIRNRQYPWGLPHHLLTEKERQSIILGNRCFKTCLKLMQLFDQYHIPYILENPATSKAWFLPQMLHHSQKPHIQMVRADFCQFGTPWKKPTLFMCGHLDSVDLHRLARTCSGPRGQCCRTQQPHFQLTGSCRDGRPWTRVAQPYPRRLCVALAHALTAHSHLNSASNFF